jgi:glycerol uptake facilitator-like aquaporin
MAAQLVGVLLAALTFWCAAGGSLHETALPAITTCDTVPWRSALLTQCVFTAAFVYVALSAWDSTALELSNTCTFYGLCVGTSSYASITGIQCRGMGSGLLNPWVGVLGFFTDATLVPCRGVHILGPLLGGVIGVLLSWLTSLTGSE